MSDFVFAYHRGNTRVGTGGAAVEVTGEFDAQKNFFVAAGAAPFSEITRAGGMYTVFSAAATPLVVFPSTLTILEVYNNSSGYVLDVIDLLGFHLLGTAVLHSVSLWGQVTINKAAPSTSSVVFGSNSGRAPITATAGSAFGAGAGTTVIANGWRPFGNQSPGVVATATPGESWSAPVDGKLEVPYGSSLCVTAVDTVATASSVQVGATINLRAAVPN